MALHRPPSPPGPAPPRPRRHSASGRTRRSAAHALGTDMPHQRQRSASVSVEFVDAHHRRNAGTSATVSAWCSRLAHPAQQGQVLLRVRLAADGSARPPAAAVHLQRPDGGHQHSTRPASARTGGTSRSRTFQSRCPRQSRTPVSGNQTASGPSRSPMTEDCPMAMLANGPACTSTGWCSTV